MEALPVTDQEVRMQTCRDPVLSRVLELVQSGWEGAEVHPEWDRNDHTSWNSYVGKQSCGSYQAKRKSSGNSPQGTHRYGQDKRQREQSDIVEDVKRPQIIQLAHPCTDGITRSFPGKGFK